MSVQDGRITNRATPVGKSDKMRFIRPVERQRMRPWLTEHLDKNDVPGLVWQNRRDRAFRISWKHAANQCFNMEKDTNLFERWAIHTGRHQDSDHKRWKANFRCALNSLPDVQELKEQGIKKGNNAFKVYKFLDEREAKTNKDGKVRKKKSTDSGIMDYVYVKGQSQEQYEDDDEFSVTSIGRESGATLPNLPQLQQPSTSGVDMLVEADHSEDSVPVNMDNLQEILTAATASLAAGGDALALEQISIEQLSKLGDMSRMKLDIRHNIASGTDAPDHMYVFLCNWCEKVFPSKVELFQHFLVLHQDKLLAGEEYLSLRYREGTDLQREIEDLEKKVLNFTREKFKTKESCDVIEDGQVVDISTPNLVTGQDVYVEDQALDLTVPNVPETTSAISIKQEVALDLTTGPAAKKLKQIGKLSQKVLGKKRRSAAMDMDYIVKFGNYGLAGAPRTKRQMSLLLKKKEEEEKARKSETESDASTLEHSMEDLVHAKILISLKSAANEENEDEEHMDTSEEEEEEKAADSTGLKDNETDAATTDTAAEGIDKDANVENKKEGVIVTGKKGSKAGSTTSTQDTSKDTDTDPMEPSESTEFLKTMKCKTCSFETTDTSTLLAHVAEHKHEYMCGMCHNLFDNKDTYVTHLASHFPPIEVSTSDSAAKLHTVKGANVCDICKKSFSNSKLLEIHKSSHYTVIPVRMSDDKRSMTMVVHPSKPLLMTSLKDAKELAAKDLEKVKVPESSTSSIIEQAPEKPEASQSRKGSAGIEGDHSSTSGTDGTKVVFKQNNDTVQVDKEIHTHASIDTLIDHKVDEMDVTSEQPHGTDSVDGMYPSNEEAVVHTKVIEKSSKTQEENMQDKDKHVDSHLPAFSEIVQNVDEFFIKEVKPPKPVETESKSSDETTEALMEEESADTLTENADTEVAAEDKRGNQEVTDEEGQAAAHKCVICHKQLTEKNFYEHMKLHSLYELATAKMSLEKMKSLDKSDASTEGTKKKTNMFICKLCGHCYETFDELRSHVTSHLSPTATVQDEGYCRKTPTKAYKGAKRGRKRQATTPELPEVQTDLKKTKTNMKQQKVEEKVKIKSPPNTGILAAALKARPKFNVMASLAASAAPATENVPSASGDSTAQQLTTKAVNTPLLYTPTPVSLYYHTETDRMVQIPLSVGRSGDASAQNTAVTATVNSNTTSTSLPTALNSTVALSPAVARQLNVLPPNLTSRMLMQSMQTILLNSSVQETEGEVTSGSNIQPTADIIDIAATQVNPQTSVRLMNPLSLTPKHTSALPLSQLGQIRLVSNDQSTPGQPQQVILLKSPMSGLGALGAVPVQIPAMSAATASPVTLGKLQTPFTNTALLGTQKIVSPGVSTVQGTPLTVTSPKITIPLSALQNLSSLGLSLAPQTLNTGQTINMTHGLGTTALQMPTTVSEAKSVPLANMNKVSPHVQSNLLNMVLARRSQPTTGIQAQLSATNVANLAGVAATSIPKAVFTLTTSQATSAVPTISSEQPVKLPGAEMSNADAGPVSTQLVLHCNLCKQKLTSLEEMSSHICRKTTDGVAASGSGFSLSSGSISSLINSSAQAAAQVPNLPIITDIQKLNKNIDGTEINTSPLKMSYTGRQQDIIKCSKCTFTSSVKEVVWSHMKQMHNIEFHECKYSKCGQCFESQRSLEVHYAVDHCFQCKICLARMKKIQVYQHAALHCVKKVEDCFMCLTCKDIFLSFELYKDHAISCSSARLLKPVRHLVIHCQGCSLSSRNKNLVAQHIKKVHTHKIVYRCHVCDAPFLTAVDQKANMVMHLAKHNPTGNIDQLCFCHKCFLGFYNKEALRLHEMSVEHKVEQAPPDSDGNLNMPHSTDPLFDDASQLASSTMTIETQNPTSSTMKEILSCDECQLVFATLFQLKQHKVIRHGGLRKKRTSWHNTPVTSKVWPCNKCKKYFVSKANLQAHQPNCEMRLGKMTLQVTALDSQTCNAKTKEEIVDIENS